MLIRARLKWKPPSENSVDFKLVLRFPPLPNNPSEPDLQAKPIFALHVWCGERSYELYDVMHVEDDEWDKYVMCLALGRNSRIPFIKVEAVRGAS